MSAPVARLGLDRSDKVFLYVVGPLVGIVLGIAVPFLARWAAELPWVPFEGPLRVAAFDSSWAVWGRPVLGALLGAGFVAYVIHQSPVVDVSAARIEISERGRIRRIQRPDVVGIYRDGRKIVVEGHQGRRLFHGEVEGKDAIVREAFVQHGYPWEAE